METGTRFNLKNKSEQVVWGPSLDLWEHYVRQRAYWKDFVFRNLPCVWVRYFARADFEEFEKWKESH